MEGFHAFDPANMGNCSQPTITPNGITRPITDYAHDGTCAVTGGYVYRGSAYSQMTGVYFFSDYCGGHIWTEEQISPGVWVSGDKLDSGYSISSFGEDQSGELDVLSYDTGQVHKIVSAPGLPAPNLSTSTKQASPANAIFGDTVTYSIVLRNTGAPFSSTMYVTDVVPAGLTYLPGSLGATRGTVNASSAPTLKWTGNMSGTSVITITYAVTVATKVGQTIVNVATVNPVIIPLFTRSASLSIANAPPELSASTKQVSNATGIFGDVLTYTIALRNTGGPFPNTVRVTDTVPIGLNYLPGSFTATRGTVDASSAPMLKWSGIMSATPSITLTYVVTVSMLDPAAITNNAIVDPGSGSPFTRSTTIVVNGLKVYLPLIFKNF